MAKPSDSAEALEVFGPCLDCENGRCTLNCSEAPMGRRDIVACAVLEMEHTPRAYAHVGILRMLARLDPSMRELAVAMFEKRNGTAPMWSTGNSAKDAQ
jgi:hypothetical protein